MTETSANVPSLTERTRTVAAGAPVVAAAFLRDVTAFVLGEDAILLVAETGEAQRVPVHGGAILCAASDGAQVITGGDDGRVMATDARGAASLIAADAKHRWIDAVAAGPNGALAWSAGKDAFVRPRKGEERSLSVASTVGGLAFAPKGLRLAIAHYNGVTLWFPNAQAPAETLEWKGYHAGVTINPNGRYLVSAMQEPALHGWRLADGKHMRMTGYTAKVHAMDWSADGEELATSGADQLVVWPFRGKDGPMGKGPRLLAPMDQRVSAVACHPKEPVAAAGYENGLTLLIRLEDGAEVVAKHPGGGAVTALAWNKRGTQLAFGTEEGEAGIVVL
ncbi:MAG: WD40 repeat domain-containing protein [Xanthobacteraceae bacterium]